MASRILFVDDEPAIRLTLPAILQQEGFQVTAVATVADALQRISIQRFDALIADLNIGEPGDGFTVVSAMRRTQPHCINFILTGYPAFETALQAIRRQVDDYLVKPADVSSLVQAIRNKLENPQRSTAIGTQSLAEFLRQHTHEIANRALQKMKANPRLRCFAVPDEDRLDHIASVIGEIVQQLGSEDPEKPCPSALLAGARHGAARKRQGYAMPMLVDDSSAIDSAIYDAVRENLLSLEVSNLLGDLKRLNLNLSLQLQQSLQAYLSEDEAA